MEIPVDMLMRAMKAVPSVSGKDAAALLEAALQATPYGVKTEPTTEGVVELSDARQKAWNAIAATAWPAYGSRRASDRTPSTTSVPEKGADAAAPQRVSAPPHFHRRYSDSIYGPPTRYEMWPHRRSTDTASPPGDKEHG